MGDASYVRSSFVGGEWSKLAQGRYHDQRYHTALNVCVNGIPIETEAWVRRPGFGLAGPTRGGNPGRVVKFDFEGNAPYTMEFTDGHLRLWSALSLVDTNDSVVVSSISTANPAVATLASAVTWATGDQGYFTLLGTSCPLLQNRVLAFTMNDTTHAALADAITGATIDGSTLGVGGLAATATLNHVLDIATPYIGGAWSSLRSVQTEQTAFLLNGSFPPYALTVTAAPTATSFATFGFAAATFNDGPYLDPFSNGAQVVPSAKTGIVTLAVQFPAFSSTTAYTVGDFVSSSGINYQSLVDQNVGKTPASNPSFWTAVSAGVAINGGKGFLQTDVGRSVRLFSEPALWVATQAYTVGQVVSYNPSNLPGQTTYYQCAVANTGIAPGSEITHWTLLSQGGMSSPALWTWGTITSLANFIAGNVAGVAQIGNMSGLANAFDGTISSPFASSAHTTQAVISGSCYVGQNYKGGNPTAYAIASAAIFPSTDKGFCTATITPAANSDTGIYTTTVTARLYGSNTAPTSATNGTLLGSQLVGRNVTTTGFSTASIPFTFTIGSAPLAITSSDQVTQYSYVWITLVFGTTVVDTFVDPAGISFTGSFQIAVSQAEFVNAAGASTSASAVNVEILGPSLLYTTAISAWRLGVYSNTTGWPTCGTYAGGRIWLSGAVPNRVDSSVSNGITGTDVNFAPTDQYGNVLDSSGISAVFNAPDANPILWMIPDLQGILAGTQAGEWLVIAPSSGPITPTNIDARRVTRIGCANIEPQRTEHTIAFVQKYLRNVMEYFADVFSGKFTAPKLTINAKHLTVGNVQEIAYQQELCPILWARVNNGLIGCTYKRNTLMTSQGPDMMGWHRHTLGSGRDVESICVGSSVNGNLDALTAVTNDLTTNIRFVEILTDILDEGSLNSAASYLDAAITPTSTTSSGSGLTLNGLWALNGKTVTAWLGGLDCGDYTVSNGSITVPYGDGVGAGTANGLFTAAFVSSGVTFNGVTMFTGTMPMRVGFTYTSQGQLTRPIAPQEAGSRNGPGFGKLGRLHYFMVQLEGATTSAISFSAVLDSSLLPALLKQPNNTGYTIDLQFTGIFRDNINSDYDFDHMASWQVTRPYICNIAALGAAIHTEDV